jgi:hypothetical protein
VVKTTKALENRIQKSRRQLRRAERPALGARNISLSHQLIDDVSGNVGKSKIAARVAERKPGVIEPQQMENRGMQIMDVNRFFDRFETVLVGSAVNVAAAHPATCHPHREAMMVVVASVDFSGIGAGSW